MRVNKCAMAGGGGASSGRQHSLVLSTPLLYSLPSSVAMIFSRAIVLVALNDGDDCDFLNVPKAVTLLETHMTDLTDQWPCRRSSRRQIMGISCGRLHGRQRGSVLRSSETVWRVGKRGTRATYDNMLAARTSDCDLLLATVCMLKLGAAWEGVVC